MTESTPEPRSTEGLAVAALDHHFGALGYAAVPDPRPAGGGWRRLYMGPGPASVVSVVGPAVGAWCSIGVEFPARRAAATDRMESLVQALAPYEVAIDLDAGDGRSGADVAIRIALRVFVEGLTGAVVRDVLDNVAEAGAVAKRVLGA